MLLAMMAIFLLSCEKDEQVLTSKIEETTVEMLSEKPSNGIINQFDIDKFKNIIPYNFSIDWSTIKKQKSNEFEMEFYEFPIIYNDFFNLENLNAKKKEGEYAISYKLLASEKGKKTYSYYIIKFYEKIELTYQLNDKSINLNNFNGIVHVYDENEDLVFAKKIENKKVKEDKFLRKKDFSSSLLANRVDESCYESPIYHYTVWYKITYDSDGKHVEYSSTENTGVTYETVCNTYWLPDLNSSSGTGAGTYIGSGDGAVYEDCIDPIHDCIYEIEDALLEPDYVINNLKGTPKCVFESLEKLNLFKNTINEFVDNPDFHLQINYSNDCQNYNLLDVKGCTNADLINSGLIIVNITDRWGGNKLSLASTMLHEGIHAELYRYAASKEQSTDPNIDDIALMDVYLRYNNLKSKTKQIQHEYMMSHYVKPIAQAIRALDNNSYPIDYYYGFGWSGLERYGFKHGLLTGESNDYFENLKQIVNTNTAYGLNCN